MKKLLLTITFASLSLGTAFAAGDQKNCADKTKAQATCSKSAVLVVAKDAKADAPVSTCSAEKTSLVAAKAAGQCDGKAETVAAKAGCSASKAEVVAAKLDGKSCHSKAVTVAVECDGAKAKACDSAKAKACEGATVAVKAADGACQVKLECSSSKATVVAAKLDDGGCSSTKAEAVAAKAGCDSAKVSACGTTVATQVADTKSCSDKVAIQVADATGCAEKKSACSATAATLVSEKAPAGDCCLASKDAKDCASVCSTAPAAVTVSARADSPIASLEAEMRALRAELAGLRAELRAMRSMHAGEAVAKPAAAGSGCCMEGKPAKAALVSEKAGSACAEMMKSMPVAVDCKESKE